MVAKTDMGLRLQPLISRGQLVPDEVVIELVATELANNKSKGYILDGNFNNIVVF